MSTKKSGKAKRVMDARGYSTVSVPPKSAPQPAPTPAKPMQASEAEAGPPQNHSALIGAEEEVSKEDLEHAKHVASEVAYILKCKTQKIYKGRLYPPFKTEIQLRYSMRSKRLLDDLVSFIRNSHCCDVPVEWRCSSWNYERAAKNLHALEAAGLTTEQAESAITQMKGYDERAAFEYAIEHLDADALPPEWFEYPKPPSGDPAKHDADPEIRLQLQLQMSKDTEAKRLASIDNARELVHSIEKELDNQLLPTYEPEQSLLAEPQSPTSKYKELTKYSQKVLNAMKVLESNKDKTLLNTKYESIKLELQQLRPHVDFKSLKAPVSAEPAGVLAAHGTSADALDVTSSTMTCVDPDEASLETGAVADGAPIKMISDRMEENGVEEANELLGMMFEEVEASSAATETTGSACPAAFEFVRSKKLSPSKLLDSMISDVKYFETINNKAQQCIERINIGPLSASGGRITGMPRGSFLSASPDLPSKDTQSARELACLRVLFEITADADKRRVVGQLSPCVERPWTSWASLESHRSEQKLKELARKRALVAEAALSKWTERDNLALQTIPALIDGADERVDFSATRRFTSREVEEVIRGRSLLLEDARAGLPATKQAGTIMREIENSEICIIAGDTGSGKSTQVPQLLLRCGSDADRVINIIVTEPRRVAAISVSDRVRSELGDEGRATSLCGYTVRLDSNIGPRCVLEYVTIGVLLRRIQSSRGACLSAYSHVFVDEVHERSVDSDLLLLLLREYKERCNSSETSFPRIVLMSATADIAAISAYWSQSTAKLGMVTIEGRTFPIDVLYLEDAIEALGFDLPSEILPSLETEEFEAVYDSDYSDRTNRIVRALDASTINYQLLFLILRQEMTNRCKTQKRNGAVIVFLPGLEEIRRLIGMIEADKDLLSRFTPIPMHSSLSSQDLQKAFRRVESSKCKIVVSTNICETGVTIDDVDLVLDTGLVKSVVWNEVTETSRLRLHMCSVAEALQRRGRAGRVRPGRCIHLFSRRKMDSAFEGLGGRMIDRPEPEMKRAPLTSPILSLTDQGLEPRVLLAAPGETVTIAKLTNAINTLLELGALVETTPPLDTADDDRPSTTNETASALSRVYSPTSLGRFLALLPCDPRSGKVLIAAYHLNCLASAAVFVASLDSKSIFVKGQQSDVFFRNKFVKRTESDAVCIVNAFSEWLREGSSLEEARAFPGNRMDVGKRGPFIGSADRYRWCRDNGVSMPALIQLSGIAADLVHAVTSAFKTAKLSCRNNEKEPMPNMSAEAEQAWPRIVEGDSRAGGWLPRSGDSSSTAGNDIRCLTCSTDVGMHCCVLGGSRHALHAAIATGMGNNVSFRVLDSEAPRYLSGNKSTIYCRIHGSSLASKPGEYVVYCNQMISTSGNQSLLNVISIDPMTMLLFSPWTKIFHGEGTVIIGRGIGVSLRQQTLVALRRLRALWERALMGVPGEEGGGGVSREQTVSVLLGLIDSSSYY